MIKFLAFIFLLYSVHSCFAGEAVIRYGLGFAQPEGSRDALVKTLGVGFRNNLNSQILWQVETGMFSDSQSNLGRNSAATLKAQLGIAPSIGAFYAGAFFGAGGISKTDTLLSSHFQFFHDLELGFRDAVGTGMAFGWSHISNAGLSLPNHGRDFLCVRLLLGF